ncbi:MAG: fimbrial biogenesis chaperone [Vulcanimicrobiaceae bacterium]
MKMHRLVSGLVAALAIIVLVTAAGESAGVGLDVTPAKLEIAIPPGTFYNIPITIHNSSAQPTHILASMVDFGVTMNGSYVFERPGTRPYSLMRWATINPQQFDLAPNSTEQVRLSLSIPKNKHLSGEYAGIVFFTTRPTRRAGVVAFSARIGTKIYATIPGTVKIDGAVVKMFAAARPQGEIYRVMFKNTGNAHVYLHGQLQVQRSGQTVEQIAMPSELLVERGGEREITVTGKKLPPGSYQAIATIDYGGKSLTGGEIAFSVH